MTTQLGVGSVDFRNNCLSVEVKFLEFLALNSNKNGVSRTKSICPILLHKAYDKCSLCTIADD